MTRRNIGYAFALVYGVVLCLYGFATQRATGDDLHAITAGCLYLAGIAQFAALFVRYLQTGVPAAVRAAGCSTALILRAVTLLVAGSSRADRTSELIGAGLAVCVATFIVLFRALIEVTSDAVR